MYEQHFGLSRRPFRSETTGKDVFVGPSVANSMADIKKALAADDAIVTVAGAVGSGKSTLIAHTLASISGNRIIVRIARMRLRSEDVLELLLDELGVEVKPQNTIQRFAMMRRKLKELEASKTRVIVTIEDAVRLGADTLSEIETLTSADAGPSEGASVILMGDESLYTLLGKSQLARAQQRIRQRLTIAPLSATEMHGYLRHCFRLVGGEFDEIFESNAAQTLHGLSGGVPRVCNNLVESAMTAAVGENLNQVPTQLLIQIAENDYGLDASNLDMTAPPEAPLQQKPIPEPAPQPIAAEPVPAPAPQPVAAEPIPPPAPQPVAAEPVPAPAPQPVAAEPVPAPAPQPVAAKPAPPPAPQPVAAEPVPAPAPQPVAAEPAPAPAPQPVAKAPAPAPAPQPVAKAPAPAPQPAAPAPAELQLETEPSPDKAAMEKDPTMPELKPDLDALEQAMALAKGASPEAVEETVEEVKEPELNVIEDMPQITLDDSIDDRVKTAQAKMTDEADAKPKSDVAPEKPNKVDEAEFAQMAADLSNAESLEDIDDKLAETLFGEELNSIAAQFAVKPQPDKTASAPKKKPDAPKPGVSNSSPATATQRLRTVKALNKNSKPAAPKAPTGNGPPKPGAPASIEDQFGTPSSDTQTQRVLNVVPPNDDNDADDDESKGGFFSRFKRS